MPTGATTDGTLVAEPIGAIVDGRSVPDTGAVVVPDTGAVVVVPEVGDAVSPNGMGT